MQGKAQPLLVSLLPSQLFYIVCSSIKGWRVWAGTATFCAFLWAVMTGACGQQVLFGTSIQPHMCGAQVLVARLCCMHWSCQVIVTCVPLHGISCKLLCGQRCTTISCMASPWQGWSFKHGLAVNCQSQQHKCMHLTKVYTTLISTVCFIGS